MKKAVALRNPVWIILRDNRGKGHRVAVKEGAKVDIDIYRGSMVMISPKYYDTNEEDAGKKYFYDGGMDFIATKTRVEAINKLCNSYDIQEYIHIEYIRKSKICKKGE